VFETGLCFSRVIGLYRCEFVFAVNGFIVKDAIQFKGEFEGWNEDVKFTIDGIFTVEMEFK